MQLYSTILQIQNEPVHYEVSRQEGKRLLLFKPELPVMSTVDTPIFWAAKQDGKWTLLNVDDHSLITQVLEDILAHGVD